MPSNPMVTYTHICERCGQGKARDTETRPPGWVGLICEVQSLVRPGVVMRGRRVLCDACWAQVQDALKAIDS